MYPLPLVEFCFWGFCTARGEGEEGESIAWRHEEDRRREREKPFAWCHEKGSHNTEGRERRHIFPGRPI